MIWLLAPLLIGCMTSGDPVAKWTIMPQVTAPHYLNFTQGAIQKCINWYHEKTPDGYMLNSLPGLCHTGTTANNAACRAAYSTGMFANQILYSVNGNKIYGIDSSGTTATVVATLGSSSGEVYFAENTTRLLIIDVSDKKGYVFNPLTNALTQIVDANFPTNPGPCAYMDGRFLVPDLGSGIWRTSAIEDGATWTPLVFATAESNPDPLIAIARAQSDLYMIGVSTTEIWAGQADNPYFAPIIGAVIPIGTTDPMSIARYKDSLFLYGSGSNTKGAVHMITGSQAVNITPPYIAAAIEQWPTGFSDIRGYCYNDRGHDFYEIVYSLGAGNDLSSFIYDINLKTWNETKGTSVNREPRVVINGYRYAAAIALDNSNGNIYLVGSDFGPQNYDLNNGNPITRTVDFTVDAGMSALFMYGMRFEFEAIHGSASSYTFSATLSWSDNNGLTFTTPITLSKAVTSGLSAQRITLTTPPLGRAIAGRTYRLVTTTAARIMLRRGEILAEQGRF